MEFISISGIIDGVRPKYSVPLDSGFITNIQYHEPESELTFEYNVDEFKSAFPFRVKWAFFGLVSTHEKIYPTVTLTQWDGDGEIECEVVLSKKEMSQMTTFLLDAILHKKYTT